MKYGPIHHARVVEVEPIRRAVPLERHIARPTAAFWLTAALACAVWVLAARNLDPASIGNTTTGLVTGLAVFYGLVPVMAVAMAGVGLVPVVALAPIALVFRIATGRPSGFGSLASSIFRPAARLVPGYVHALRGVRSPAVWGLVLGSSLAAPILLLGPAAGS